MATPSVLLIAVLACDYQKTVTGKQDGQTLGPHSLTRLDAAIAWAEAQTSFRPVFVFSADRLKPEHQRLCDLQAEYVRHAGFTDVIVPDAEEAVWGSVAELQYAATVARSMLYGQVHLVVVTEDYHMYPRTHRLAREICDPVLLQPARRLPADSSSTPPSFGERCHEWLWLALRQLPASWRQWLSARRRARLASGTE